MMKKKTAPIFTRASLTIYIDKLFNQSKRRTMKNIVEAQEKKIDAFKEKIEEAGSEVKAKFNEEVAILEQKNSELKKKLKEYKGEGQSKWKEFKTNFTHDMDGIKKTMKDLVK